MNVIRPGVPAAFSPACSESHIPGYVNAKELKDAGRVFVVSGEFRILFNL